jgi:hypothetical protein
MARFRGVITHPLYIAPWQVPANLLANFVGVNPSFDRASIHPIIQSAFTSNGNGAFYYNAVVPQPFDFGQTYVADLPGPVGGVFPFFAFDPIGGPASYIGAFKDGNGATDVNASGKILATGQPYRGGNAGEYNIDPPQQVIDQRSDNGITNQGYQGPFYWHPQSTLSGSNMVWSPLGVCNLYSCYNTNYTMYWAEGQEPLVLANWSDIISSIGLPFGASSEAIYWPGSLNYNYGRYYPWQINPLPGGGLEPGGGGALPIEITFDHHPGLQIYTRDKNNFQANDVFLIFICPVRQNDGQAFTVVLLDTKRDHYYFLAFVPKTARASVALSDISGGMPSVAQDPNGVWYVLSQAPALRGFIFHTVRLDLDYYPVTLEPPTPFVLPCFNPCVPFAILQKRKPIP